MPRAFAVSAAPAFPPARKWRSVRGEPGAAADGGQWRRGRARHLQGPLLSRNRSAPVPRRHADRRPCRSRRRTSTSICATNIRRAASILQREIAKVCRPAGPRIHLRRGAGAYICGEESAMLESLEGKRGLPRHKPPYPFQVGLFGRPTLINNVETLFWVRDIVEKGADWWTSQGRNGRQGAAQLLGLRPGQVARRQARARRHHGARADRRILRRHGGRPHASRLSAGRRVGRHPAGLDGRYPARFRHAGEVRLLHRLGRRRRSLAIRTTSGRPRST